MIKNAAQLEQLLANESLSDLNILSLNIPDTIDCAFAVEVNSNALHLWTTLRNLLPKTGMWPVLYLFWGNPQNSWEEYVKADDVFKRRPFEWEIDHDNDISPEAIVARAEITSFNGLLGKHASMYSENLADDFHYSLEKTQAHFGVSPDTRQVEALIKSASIADYIAFEKWLLDWELANISREKSLPPPHTDYIDWYVPHNEPQALILLPTRNCWEALAYIHWYGSGACGSETAIAMLQWWNEQYGAELVAHYGTMLHFSVGKKPDTIDKAFRLAWEQEALAPCTTALPGQTLRDHARTLLQADKWFLHERP
ncbi:MAG: hypothetical protein AMJ53_11415 [Gammaproteobacteria bacterium SG8_11]|nr:MAG: hypothetical protein AMJ53_11415 [Gammaproteobacteria bacterium SG8_11]